MFYCNFCFADTIKIKLECNSKLIIILTSGVDTLHNSLHEGKEIIIHYQQKNDELIRFIFDNEIYYIIPKRLTQIRALCKKEGYELYFYNKEDRFYNNVSTTRIFRKKNYALAYQLVSDTTLTVQQQDSIRRLMGTMRVYRDSLECTSMLAHAPSKASLYFLNYNFSDKYYSKKYFVQLYKKIITSQKICKAHQVIINEIGKKLNLPTYSVNDTILIPDANSIFFTEKDKNMLCVIVGPCHATKPNLLAIEAKQAELQNKGIMISVIATYIDDEVEAICKKNNWQYNINEQFRETNFAYKLWTNSSFIAICFENRRIVSITSNIADLR